MSIPATARGWGPGWPTNRQKEMRLVTAPSGAKWWVHHEIAPIVQWLVTEIERRGYLFDNGPADVDDDWGYANRAIRGTHVPSNHSWGLAIDFNAQDLPQHSNKRAPQWVYDLFYAYGFEIGADWSIKSRDPMHVEFRGTVNEARALVAMLAASHLAGLAPDIPATTPAPPAGRTIPLEGPVFLIVDNVGLFAGYDGVLSSFPNLASYAEAVRQSPNVPVMHLPETVGRPLVAYSAAKAANA